MISYQSLNLRTVFANSSSDFTIYPLLPWSTLSLIDPMPYVTTGTHNCLASSTVRRPNI